MSDSQDKIRWHLLLGRLFTLIFEPLQVQVQLEVPLVTEPLKADIVLLRRQSDSWTVEQRQWMADGLRHTDARHLLIEFKRSEGLTLSALQQLTTYDYLYRRMGNYAESDVTCFLIAASTPQSNWQERFDFIATEWLGVYQGNNAFVNRVLVLLLNELTPTAHNAPLKCFATRRREQERAFTAINNSGFTCLSRHIDLLISGLRRVIGMQQPTPNEDLTPDMVMEMGREWIDSILRTAPIEDFLHYRKPDEVLSHYNAEQRIAGLTEEQRMAGLTEEQRMAGLTEEQIRAYLARLPQIKH